MAIETTQRRLLLEDLNIRLTSHNGDRGHIYLDGKAPLMKGTYASWVQRALREEDAEYANALIKAQLEKHPISSGAQILTDRVNMHLVRMLRPEHSSTENEFARAFIIYAPAWYEGLLANALDTESQRVKTVLGGENANTTFWWTVAPYIFAAQTKLDTPPETAIQDLLNWAANTTTPRDESEYDTLTLPGTEYLAWGKYKFVLTNQEDQETWTHETAALLAHYLEPIVATAP